MKQNNGMSKKDFPHGTFRMSGEWHIPGVQKTFLTKQEVLDYISEQEAKKKTLLPVAKEVEATITVDDAENLKSIEETFEKAHNGELSTDEASKKNLEDKDPSTWMKANPFVKIEDVEEDRMTKRQFEKEYLNEFVEQIPAILDKAETLRAGDDDVVVLAKFDNSKKGKAIEKALLKGTRGAGKSKFQTDLE